MISQGFLHVCECTLNHIVRVGHTIDILICEQERQVSRYANHGRPESLMGVNWTACDLVDSLFLQEVMPFLLPLLELADECILVHAFQAVCQLQQFLSCLKLRLLSHFSPYYRHHVKLAHLYPVFRKDNKQLLQSIYDNPMDEISASDDMPHCFLVVADVLVCDMLHVKKPSGSAF